MVIYIPEKMMMEVSSLEKLEVEVIWFQLYKYLLSTILLLGTVTVITREVISDIVSFFCREEGNNSHKERR